MLIFVGMPLLVMPARTFFKVVIRANSFFTRSGNAKSSKYNSKILHVKFGIQNHLPLCLPCLLLGKPLYYQLCGSFDTIPCNKIIVAWENALYFSTFTGTEFRLRDISGWNSDLFAFFNFGDTSFFLRHRKQHV